MVRAAVVSEDEILAGSMIGERYHVGGVLGRGATGSVFAAENVHLRRPCAMKVLRPRWVPLEQILHVWTGEARGAWSIVHPCLAEVFDAGVLPDGAPFFVMERLDGETLAARIARAPLSIAAAVDVLMQILSALDALHARGVLARDLRPQNVFLAHRRGCRPIVKLLDVGLARLLPLDKVREQWDAAAAGEGLAAPHYLSPERARSEKGLEPASDLFVAAAILYEALTGVRAFRAASFDALLQTIAHASPAPMTQLRDDVPPELDALVARTLSADPRTRPASARALQDDLWTLFGEGGAASLRARPSSAPPPIALPVSATMASAGESFEEETRADPRVREMALAAARAHGIDVPNDAPATSRGTALEDVYGETEDRTETMQLAPELRARLEQTSKRESDVPLPPTRRIKQ